MNRKERRAIGFTEPRYRKTDLERPVRWYDDAFKSFSRPEAFKLGSMTMQRTQRLDKKPRRWQAEKARRRLQQLIWIEEELGINDYG